MTASVKAVSGQNDSSASVAPTAFDRKAAEVLRSFNTWAFKREQPTEPELLAQVVALRLWQEAPISFVLYWGKGPRARIADPDRLCLKYLDQMGKRIASAYEPGAQFHLCLTDTHARLNGHPERDIDTYFGDIAEEAGRHGMKSVRLAQLVANTSAHPQPRADAANDAMMASLEKCAARWYRGGSNVRDGARTYLEMNAVESAAVAAHYRDTIFLTFNGRAYRGLFPTSMPVFYMYSLKRGTAVKPWFMDENCSAFPDADAGGAERSGPGEQVA